MPLKGSCSRHGGVINQNRPCDYVSLFFSRISKSINNFKIAFVNHYRFRKEIAQFRYYDFACTLILLRKALNEMRIGIKKDDFIENTSKICSQILQVKRRIDRYIDDDRYINIGERCELKDKDMYDFTTAASKKDLKYVFNHMRDNIEGWWD